MTGDNRLELNSFIEPKWIFLYCFVLKRPLFQGNIILSSTNLMPSFPLSRLMNVQFWTLEFNSSYAIMR